MEIIQSKTILFLITILLIPVGGSMAFAQTVDENAPPVDDLDIIPDDNTVGPVATVNELQEAHSHVTNLLLDTSDQIANTGYVNEEVYLEAVYVDEETMKLVIWLDPAQMYDPIDDKDIQEELGIAVPIEIKYGFFTAEVSSSQATSCPADSGSSICYYWGRYVDRCLPSATTSRCNTYSTIISSGGYALPTLIGSNPAPVDTDGDGIPNSVDQCDTQPETRNGYQDTDGCPDTPPTPPPTSTGNVIFSDNFESGFSKWRESGQLEWQIGTNDDGVVLSGHSSSNQIAKADDCDDQACILSLASSINLSGYTSATLEFDRYVDRGLDRNEYLSVEVGNNGVYSQVFRWTDRSGDDGLWHHERVNLAPYLRSGFDVRFLTEESSSREDVGIDNVKITARGSPQCVLTVTAALQDDGSIVASWNACNDIKRYKVYASENNNYRRYLDPTTSTTYTYSNPTEGSSYEILVRAQKQSDNRYTEYFKSNKVTVPISDSTAPIITVPKNIVVDATSTGNPTVSYTVSAYDAVDGTISVRCAPISGGAFSVGSTTVTCTARDAAGNDASKSFVVTVNAYVASASCSTGPFRESGDDCEDDRVDPVSQDSKILYGGKAIGTQYKYINTTDQIDINSDLGAITIGFIKDDGTKGIIVAGHQTVPKLNSANESSKVLVTNFDGMTEFVTTQGFPRAQYQGTKADTAFVSILDGYDVSVDRILRHDGTYLEVTKKGGIHDVGIFPNIKLFGAKTNSAGYVLRYNATIIDNDGILLEQALGRYNSMGGDSGGSIVHQYHNNTSSLFGSHVGVLCSIVSDTTPIIPLLTGGVYCHNLSQNLKVISTWENIAEELELQ